MKYYFVIAIFISSVLLTRCVTQKAVQYEFPTEMSPYVKSEFMKQCEKGKVLYDLNCGACHTSKLRGKEIIPDFSLEQLKGYELRVANPQHESNMTETSVTAEELGHIMTFLTYKKKNN